MSGKFAKSSIDVAHGPISVGAGLVALDWLLIGDDRVRPNEVYAGGSCGNVMAILAFLGWQSYPIARLARDHRADQVIADLQKCNVRTEFVLRKEHGTTPVIIVRIRESEHGTYKRRYEWKHPASGEWLPRYTPVPKSLAEVLSPQLPNARIFYFDRAERSSLALATFMRERGSVVFFEPCSSRNAELFSDCLAVADIVKYSAERLPSSPKNPICKSPRLEIQTMGEEGLRYRLKLNSNTPGPWKTLGAFPTDPCVDATGCGDWCSAGLIHRLCQSGRDHFMNLQESEIAQGLQFGQALASINCSFMGARTPMYQLTLDQLLCKAANLMSVNAHAESHVNEVKRKSSKRHPALVAA